METSIIYSLPYMNNGLYRDDSQALRVANFNGLPSKVISGEPRNFRSNMLITQCLRLCHCEEPLVETQAVETKATKQSPITRRLLRAEKRRPRNDMMQFLDTPLIRSLDRLTLSKLSYLVTETKSATGGKLLQR